MGTKAQVGVDLAEPPDETSSNGEPIAHLKEQAYNGKHWFIAILEAISLWTSPQETYKGRTYTYLVGNEAFDWLLLVERLCEEVEDLVPDKEKVSLLFEGKLPMELENGEFQRLLGPAKHKAHLNFFYGVIVEECVIKAFEERSFKESIFKGCSAATASRDRAFQQLYGASELDLLLQFRSDLALPHIDSITLDELREFTYWLFKYRLKHSHKAKIASDTKKGLLKLQEMWNHRGRVLAKQRRQDRGHIQKIYQLV